MLRHRHLVPELMDADDVDPRELSRALRFIRRINKLLRYNATLVRAIGDEIARLPRDRPTTVLDVAAGSGDLLAELSTWSGRAGRSLEMLGLDRHAATVAEGVSGEAAHTGVRFLRADALTLPFADGSVDIVCSTMFIHHLTEADATAALAEMRRVARHAVVVADLIRTRRALVWITLFTLRASKMIKHDARASVKHAFTVKEARSLAMAAGMADAKLTVTFGHRFLMTWRRW